jgi:hypothetical protein
VRRWTKYYVSDSRERHTRPDDYAQMDGYGAGPGYATRRDFFAVHLHSQERLVACEHYLADRISAEDRVLSVASGRCATELHLQEAIGCSIVCSEREVLPCLAATKALFPELEFRVIDVLGEPPPDKFDIVISLSLIYAFDDRQLSHFFGFVSKALEPGGKLILDFVGAPDNAATYIFHDLYLPVEAAVAAAALTLKHRQLFGVARQAHGYRRTCEDVNRIAQACGFVMSDYWEGAFTTDFERSLVLSRMSRASPAVNRALSKVGRVMPYVRIATFRQPAPNRPASWCVGDQLRRTQQ